MSIAVRVSVWILGGLVVVSAAVAVLALIQKQTLEGQYHRLQSKFTDDENQLADLRTKANKLEADAGQLNNKISQAQQAKIQAQSLYDDLKHKSDDLQAQLGQANADRNDWKDRAATIRRERDDLMQKLKSRPTQIVYKDRIVQAPAVAVNNLASTPPMDTALGQGEKYWAAVFKQKAALEIELQKEKSDLDQAALQVVDLKKQNSDLQVEVKQLNNEKDEIIQKIKYGQDLADNLSIDLARSRNDQQGVNDRADKLKAENLQLLSQIRDLSSTKLELEKTIARLTDDKDAMQRKLIEMQSVIQSRIDDIWKIKQGLDKKLSENTAVSSPSGSMELPPIIVNAPPAANPASVTVGKTQGSIISINEPNNFVIVDLGQENSSVSVGNPMKVYRNANEIAALEVIQVRRDICAADIKTKSVELKVGDVVKL